MELFIFRFVSFPIFVEVLVCIRVILLTLSSSIGLALPFISPRWRRTYGQKPLVLIRRTAMNLAATLPLVSAPAPETFLKNRILCCNVCVNEW